MNLPWTAKTHMSCEDSAKWTWSTCVPADDSGMSHAAGMLEAPLGSPNSRSLIKSPPSSARHASKPVSSEGRADFHLLDESS